MNIYLLKSDSRVLIEEELEKLIPKDQVSISYVYEKNLENILEEASYVSLFDEKKYLIVKNANFFGKEKLSEKETDLLNEYLEHPYVNTIIFLITYEEIDKRKGYTKKIIEKYSFKEMNAPKGYELTNEIKKRTNMYKIPDPAIKYLIEASLNNFDLIINEISKFSLIFSQNDSISLAQMKEIVAENTSENLFKFTDAVINRNMKETFKLLNDFIHLKIDSLQLTNLLVREFRLLFYYKIYEKKQFSNKEIGKSLGLQDWQVNKIMKNAVNFHEDDLKTSLISLAKMDYQVKSGNQDKTMALYNFLVEYFT